MEVLSEVRLLYTAFYVGSFLRVWADKKISVCGYNQFVGEKLNSWKVLYPRGGGLPYKRDGDARRLALGCKLQILVTLRVFEMESHYICPFRYHLGLCIKKFTKNALTLATQKSPLEFSLSFSHTHFGLPKGFN